MSVQCHLGSLSFTSWQAHNANANEQNAQASHAIIPCIVLLYQMDEFERSLYIKSLKADASPSYQMIGVHSIKKHTIYMQTKFLSLFSVDSAMYILMPLYFCGKLNGMHNANDHSRGVCKKRASGAPDYSMK